MAGIDEVLAFARLVGAGRLLRLGHCVARGDKRAVEEDVRRPYGGWRKSVDISLDAELLARQGYVFASAVCCGMALRAFPIHPKLWWRWMRRHYRNLVLLLTFQAGRLGPALLGWTVLIGMAILLVYWFVR